MSTVIAPPTADAHHEAAHHAAATGWRRWLFATNHKDIGTMYLLFSFTMFMVGGALAMLIRLELLQPGLQYFNPELYNQFVTMHGLLMVFGAIMPAFVGFANEGLLTDESHPRRGGQGRRRRRVAQPRLDAWASGATPACALGYPGPKGEVLQGAHSSLPMLAGAQPQLRSAPRLRPLQDLTRVRFICQ